MCMDNGNSSSHPIWDLQVSCKIILAFTVKCATNPIGSKIDMINDRASLLVGIASPEIISFLIPTRLAVNVKQSLSGFQTSPSILSFQKLSFSDSKCFCESDRKSFGIFCTKSLEFVVQL